MRILLFLICFLFESLFCFAQETSFHLRNVSFPPQFKNQIIKDVAQDKAGLLWIVTNNGLYRYDGNEIFHLNEKEIQVPDKNIATIMVDRQNNLWIGAKEGLFCFNLNKWITKKIQLPSELPTMGHNICILTQDNEGNIFAGSKGGQVYHVQEDSVKTILDVKKSTPERFKRPFITLISTPYPGQLWIGSSTGAFIRIKEKNNHFHSPEYFLRDKFQGDQIAKVIFGSDEKCLLSVAHHGTYLFDIQKNKLEKIPGKYGLIGKTGQVFMASLNNNKVMMFTNAREVGKNKLFIYNFAKASFTEQHLNFPSFLKDNHFVWFYNLGHTILLSLNGHIMELNPGKKLFKSYLVDEKALSSIRSIYKSPDGALYVGSYRDGFLQLNEKTGKKRVIARKYVYCMLPWNKDSLLLGTEGDGLLWYEPQLNRLSKATFAPSKKEDRKIGHFITTLTREKQNRILVGTYTGLFSISPNSGTSQTVQDDQLSGLKIYNVLKLENNQLIATQYGIQKINSSRDSITSFFADSSIKNTVYSMVKVNGKIWAGTGALGILVMDKNGVITDTLNNRNGLAGNSVFSLTTTEGLVIAGTQNGLSIIDANTKRIKNYFHLDQLPAEEFNSAAAFRTGKMIYLGTINGLLRFNVDRLTLQKSAALQFPLHITQLSVGYKNGEIQKSYAIPYQETPRLTIPSNVSYFSIGLGSTDDEARSLEYYYRLEEDQKWNKIGQRGKINFVKMAPGQYQLQCKGRLPDGNWSKILLNIPLIVKPTFYQSPWFKILIVLVILGLFWIIFKFREKEREKERQLRIKIAGDLHDEVGSTLAGMSMQADMLLRGHQEHLKSYLKDIAHNGRAAVHTMRDIVWSIDPRNDDSISLMDRLERYAGELLEPTVIDFNFHQKHQGQLPISQKIRQNIMLIYKEAITNICKHAEASKVDVFFTFSGKKMQLIIIDDGRGMKDRNNGGHGLRNMQMRANAINAQLYFPEVDSGVKIILKLKV